MDNTLSPETAIQKRSRSFKEVLTAIRQKLDPSSESWFALFKHGFSVIRNWFPLTWTSIVLGILLYYTWFWEVSSHANQILYTVVLLFVFVFAVLLFFTLLATLIVYFSTRCHNSQIQLCETNEVGGHITSNYEIFSPFFLPFATIETDLVEKEMIRHIQKRSIWEREWLEPLSRGRYQKLHRKVTVKDIFGLTSITFVITQNVSLEIHPATQNYEVHAFQTQTQGDGYSHPQADPKGELVEMRRYQAGDPLRLVLWKVFARSRKLVVRSPEPAIVEQNDMFVYFVSGPDDESSASMAKAFLSTYQDMTTGNLSFSADGSQRIVSNKTEGVSDIIDSVQHRKRGGQDLLTVAPLVSPEIMAHCFLIVPPKPGSWIEAIKRFIAKYHVKPVFIISVSGQKMNNAKSKPSLWRRILLNTQDDSSDNSALTQTCEQLKTLGTVRLVDVSNGITKDYQEVA